MGCEAGARRFSEFVKREDSSVLPAMEAIAATATQDAAAEGLRITKTELRRLSNRLRKLGQSFLGGEARRRRYPKPQPRTPLPAKSLHAKLHNRAPHGTELSYTTKSGISHS